MNQMYLNGIDISEYGLYLLRIPPVVKPQRRVRRYQIPGRSGYLTEWSGDYDGYTKEAVFLYQGEDLDEALNFLRSAELVTFPNEPDMAYEVRVDDLLNTELGRACEHQITVAFYSHPLKHMAVETTYTGATTYTVTNPGNEPAQPTITVTGAGAKALTVGSQTISINFAAGGETITIDSLNGYILSGQALAWNKVSGGLPVIPVGRSPITISTTGSALTVEPNWRWS